MVIDNEEKLTYELGMDEIIMATPWLCSSLYT